ncbi:glycosyltransferase domain-containing protein [Xanthobacter sp.]|uniref:glycosyltransferase domain-containing protein n=1 Tax=Xanthobacter sp. TaxID=35809 RepID=UPI0025D89EF8|nr:glycosyltransferase domain-containing protein [Xanthobacter sp.]
MAEVPAPRACVYTCLIGGYEALNEQPMAAASGLDFLCFTDDPTLTSTTWKLVPYTPAFPLDPVRSQRMAKLSPHELLPGYDVSLYIDNSVILTVPPEEVIARYLPAGTPAAMPGHSFRASVRDEFMEVLRMGLDDGGRVLEQLNHYMMSDPAALDTVPFWSAIMLRRHNAPDVIAAMRLWLAQVLRYSRRDQLSGTYALRCTGLPMKRIEVDNLESWFHRWPVTEARDRGAFPFSPVLSQIPAALLAEDWRRDRAALEARIGVLEQALAATETGPGTLGAAEAAWAVSAASAESGPDCAPSPPISVPKGTRTSPTSGPVSWLARLASRLAGRRSS